MIAITNMERPKECEECLFYEYDSIFEEERWSSAPKCLLDGDSDDCPLIEISDIEYKAFKEFMTMLVGKIEERILYGERRNE